MPNPNIEGTVAPNSVEAQALAELQKEGHEVATGQPDAIDGEVKDTPVIPKEVPKDVPPKDEPAKVDPPKDEHKPERTPTMVEAWKLKVAQDQKAGLEKDLQEMKAKIDDLSKQKSPVTEAQKTEIADEIKAIAEEAGVDAGFLTKFADTLLKKANANRPSSDVEKTLESIKQEREVEKQLNAYNTEFENDVMPLVKGHNLSDTALSELKKTLKDYAFSETYAKVPLKEIFRIKEEALDLKSPKKSSEGKGPKVRASDMLDLDNVTEEDFAKMTPEQVDAFQSRKDTSVWKVNRK